MMGLAGLLLGSALAAAAADGPGWVASLAADAAVVTPARAAGASGMAGVLLSPRWSLEAAGMLHVVTATATATAQPLWGVRLETRWRPLPERRGPSLIVGGGLEDLAPVASAGLALDVTPRVRAQAGYRLSLAATERLQPKATTLSLGWTFPAPDRRPPVVVEPPPSDLPSLAERLQDPDPDAVRVWMPHPICAWVSVRDLEAVAASLPPETRAQLVATGYLPQAVSLVDEAPIEMKPIPLQGSVVVAAGPGDLVTLSTPGMANVPLPLSADGTVVATVAEGPFSVTISGAGRTLTREGGVFDGHGTWIVASLPEPRTVLFAGGSSVLTPAGRASLAPLGALPGTWVYQVRGAASSEGQVAVNQRLARERAAVTAAALIAAGVPEAQVQILPAVIATERAAYVTPVAP